MFQKKFNEDTIIRKIEYNEFKLNNNLNFSWNIFQVYSIMIFKRNYK